MIGSDRLVKIENELNKELDLRFKPNGRNPLLNTKLKELRQLWKELKKAEENNEQYIRLIRKKEAVEQEIAETRETAAGMSQHLIRFEELKKAEPLLRQEKILKEELAQFGGSVFPENGLQKLEHLLELQLSIERNQAVLRKRIEGIEAELAELKPDFKLIDMEQEINRASESLKGLEQWQQETLQLQVKLKKIEEDLVLLQNKLHCDFTEGDILNADTSIFMRERATQLMASQKRLNDKKQELDEQFQKEKSRLEELENRVQAMKSEIMPEIERQRLKGQLREAGTKELMQERFQEVKERLTFLTGTLEQAENYRSREKKQYFIFLFLCVLLWLQDGLRLLPMIAVGGLALLFVLILLFKKRTLSVRSPFAGRNS